MNPDIILTHGFFLGEDPQEQAIMRPYPPLGLLYLSAYLKKAGFRPEILDSTFLKREDVHRRFHENSSGVVGIYTTHMTRKSAANLIRNAKEKDCTVILGGPDSANYPAEYLALGADVVVVGEGEQTLVQLLNARPLTDGTRYQRIPGIIFKDPSGKPVRTPPCEMQKIDTLPWPDRQGIDLEAYFRAWSERHDKTSVNLITSRGCPYHCRWCSHAVFGNTHRRRNPADCADEVAHIAGTYGPDQLWYADDVFTLEHEWLFRFASELNSRGVNIPFETISRADRLLDESLCRVLAEMGCFRIWIGSESGSDRILKAMGRGVTAKQVRKATKLAQNAGIEVGWFLMWGYAGETREDIQATIDHVKQARPDIFFTTLVYPIRSTPYYEAIKDKILLPENWEEASEKENRVQGRPDASTYKLADQWLREEMAAIGIPEQNPLRKEKVFSAQQAKAEFFERFSNY